MSKNTAMLVSPGTPAARTVLITGVTRGLGRALALEIASRGHTIIGCGRDEEKLTSLQNQLGDSKHILRAVDVASDSNVQEFARAVIELKGAPDILVNNAGVINSNGKLWEVAREEFDNVIDVNIKGPANCLRHFVPHMMSKKQGVIVNFSSGWGRSAAAEVSPYCASKWAMEGLTRSLAKELPPGIAAVALNPGVICTDMLTTCFGTSAAMYQTPETWAPAAATLILALTAADNGSSLNVT
ncbi:NADPH-dependent pterin aldehyde reductase isoform X2 [Selaginella moellendorffii]|uniref:NADPH-dependent pterin aldehyde reductase isoform X2 n=1 Tax=Selaginella moellendorffii TaxID=88036 RepID=UPI000D1C9165|nr:NADPH-dependent pterin aldehyde reductase isoform X2 [Selaginella moellendorffii]|eukprot:XP_024541966.1 NADPH-dependent pterin aldehyde reductase isoform X2 [Selaginella moellendorffii]